MSTHLMRRLTVWLTSGISISVWLHSTFHVRLHTLNQVSAVEWDSEILTRTYSDLYIRFLTELRSVSSTSLQLSSRTVDATISISRLPRKVTQISEEISQTIHYGLSFLSQLTLRRQATGQFLMRWFHTTTICQ